MTKVVLTAILATISGAGSALAADMPVKAPPALPPPAYTWTGFYVGAEGGGAWGDSVQFFTGRVAAGAGGSTARYNVSGGFGGLTAGFNYQLSPHVVAGIEGDFSWAHITGTGVTSATYTCGRHDGGFVRHSARTFGIRVCQ